jgi:hypothetical protein
MCSQGGLLQSDSERAQLHAQFNEALSRLDVNQLNFLDKLRTSKIVASFLGRVESISEKHAIVLLVNEATGESQESQCDLEVLQENHLEPGDEFRMEVVRTGGKTMTQILPLPPKHVSREELEGFRREFEERWNLPS